MGQVELPHVALQEIPVMICSLSAMSEMYA